MAPRTWSPLTSILKTAIDVALILPVLNPYCCGEPKQKRWLGARSVGALIKQLRLDRHRLKIQFRLLVLV